MSHHHNRLFSKFCLAWCIAINSMILLSPFAIAESLSTEGFCLSDQKSNHGAKSVNIDCLNLQTLLKQAQSQATLEGDLELLLGKVWGLHETLDSNSEVLATWIFLPPDPRLRPLDLSSVDLDLPYGLLIMSSSLWQSIAVWQQNSDRSISIMESDDSSLFMFTYINEEEMYGLRVSGGGNRSFYFVPIESQQILDF